MEEQRPPLSQVPKKRGLVTPSVAPGVAGPPAPGRPTHHRLALVPEDPGAAWNGSVWEFSVYGEAPALAHRYPALAEAAVSSANPLLASISRLL